MITLVGGGLYQWDTGRVVSIVSENNSIIHEVHFTTNAMNFAYVVKTQVKDSTTYCQIPDILLQQYSDIYCYEVKENCKGEESVSTKILPIQKRNKPEDYTYTEQEKITIDKLQDQIDGIGETIEELNQNITDIQATAESAKTGVNDLSGKYDSLSSELDTEISNREQADTKLQGRVTKLSSSCITLLSKIDTETSNREQADANLETEISNLSNDHSTLSSKLDTEISNREQAGTNLQTEINNLKKDITNNTKEISKLKQIPNIISAHTALQIGNTSLSEERLKDLLNLANNGGVPYSETENSAGGITAKIGIVVTETENSAGGMTVSIG